MLFFVIPAHNEEALIGATIASLHRAAAPHGPYTIIVAADSCTDRTAALAEHAGAFVVPVNLRQISAVRNAGAREAMRRSTSTSDVLFFVDADTHVPPETLAASLTAIRQGAVGGGAGARFDGPMTPAAERFLAMVVILFRLFKFTGGCYLYCTRKAFQAAGGWDESLFAAEEMFMCRALKRQGRFRVGHEFVVTSGRKLRQYSLGQILGVMGRLTLRGRRALRSREGLEIWYGPRDSPGPMPGAQEKTLPAR